LLKIFARYGEGESEVIANSSPGSELFSAPEKTTVEPSLKSHSTVAGGYGVAQAEAR